MGDVWFFQRGIFYKVNGSFLGLALPGYARADRKYSDLSELVRDQAGEGFTLGNRNDGILEFSRETTGNNASTYECIFINEKPELISEGRFFRSLHWDRQRYHEFELYVLSTDQVMVINTISYLIRTGNGKLRKTSQAEKNRIAGKLESLFSEKIAGRM